jgi:PhnB protein
MKVQPYLMFEGRCEEALAFYRKALDAKVITLMRFKDSPDPPQPGMHPPGSENKVMHVAFTIGESTLFASDGRNSGNPAFQGFALSLDAKTDAEAERWFSALSDGGKVLLPLNKTFFSSRFGMLADRFGLHWWVMVAQ